MNDEYFVCFGIKKIILFTTDQIQKDEYFMSYYQYKWKEIVIFLYFQAFKIKYK